MGNPKAKRTPARAVGSARNANPTTTSRRTTSFFITKVLDGFAANSIKRIKSPGAAYCKRRKIALSAEMAKMRAKTIAVVPLIERDGFWRVEIVETFETGSSAFGIAFSDWRPVLRTRFVRKLSAFNSPRPVENTIGI